MANTYGSRDLSEGLMDFLGGVAKFLLGLGAFAVVVSVGFLAYTCFTVSTDPSTIKAAVGNVEMFQKVLAVGSVAVAVGAGFLYWMEDVVAGIMVLLSAALFFAPLYLPGMLGSGAVGNKAVDGALGAIQMGGTIMGVLSIATLIAEIAIKSKDRVKIGTKADQIKFGKGVKEEKDRQNVFMGNCWQLPYCRKFVRERCPIFHAKRTCWRERVGCMCEEEVIRNAMENKPIPKDALLAAKLIPQNHKLNLQQKIERCKTCVIYNEHQRHKYKLILPTVVVFFFAFYAALHGALVDWMNQMVFNMSAVVNNAALGHGPKLEAPSMFVEVLLFVLMLVVLSYILKLVEYFVFKVKI